ncbi:serine hydrolase FSH [Kipferlia bialata]|uniref:Serine hydrolase FSH n=1 Tax=Kipferlia bialata TaxID=797122 RepID=A0A9K3GFH7_9EUKA|nr:serine hydrolase FSH [Kipferlia bialata]|eukprot:g1065.t1
MQKTLALHGFLQTGDVFLKKLGQLRKYLKHTTTFDVIDAPVSIHPHALNEDSGLVECTAECVGVDGSVSIQHSMVPADPEGTDTNRYLGWWVSDVPGFDVKTRYYIEEALDYIEEYILETKPDVILAFSQGASSLALLLHRWGSNPPAFIKSAIMISPAGAPGTEGLDKVHSPISTHLIYGEQDYIVPNELSLRVGDALALDGVHPHDGKHFVPAASRHRPIWAEIYGITPPEQK